MNKRHSYMIELQSVIGYCRLRSTKPGRFDAPVVAGGHRGEHEGAARGNF